MRSMIKKKEGALEYALSVKGTPAIILMNGGSGPVEGWHKIYHALADDFTVLAYNRLGVGKSDRPSSPQHGAAIVSSLRELLDAIKLPPPYILVGHSLGGLYAHLFAREFPGHIAGVVLLEASHPLDLAINDTQPALIRLINRFLSGFDALSPSRKWNEIHYVEETAKQLEQAGPFPDIPLFVVTGTSKPPMMPKQAFDIRMKNQLDLVQLSKHGKQVLATRSGHFPQFTEPDLVIQTIRECVQP
ncbi:Pimeloyl-ACP methyl ester carboxylesterase [Paenibacillus catalpae]|uniref:Pimeloyl-ACP methyl ester carboxylesterase n=1 Tax=Paenibacillus catalpae TaxID=1045775 RepID=A0A1I2GKP9_9BACL|nr:alpha/beta fold hydrolase [Paenibacillus catalpae]SFF17550.1 Pimeloyl-ACP methyl ester carboxylesterase [Paenibacillus catalpae]